MKDVGINRELDLHITRRQLFGLTARGIGVGALASLMGLEAAAAGAAERDPKTGGLIGLPHFAPKAKRVIFLHQSGGPSQLETFDYKPMLDKLQGTQIPDSVRNGQRITAQTMGQSSLPLARSMFAFSQHGQAGTWVSELLPHTAKIVDDITVIKTMNTDAINHDPAITFIQTGFQQPGRPSMGAWLSYGLGSDNQNLPGVRRAAVAGAGPQHRSAALLPPLGQRLPAIELPGRPLPRGGRDPVLYLRRPARRAQDVAASDARRGGEARRHEVRRLRGSRRSKRASRSTRWRTGCRRPCPI